MVSLSLAHPSVSEGARLTSQFYLITNYNHRFLLTLFTIKVYNVKV